MLGIAVLPDRSLSLVLAAVHIRSRASSPSIQLSEEEIMEVKNPGTPVGSTRQDGESWARP